MTLELGMQQLVLKYYQMCPNDYPGLTLLYFIASSNLVPFAYKWENAEAVDFLEMDEFYEVKVSTYSQINEYMTIYDYPWSRWFIDLCPRWLRFNIFQTSFPQKPLGWLKPNFLWSLHGMWGINICSNVPGHMSMPIYENKLKKSSSSEPRGRWT